jgi:hypothetical protein
MQQVHHVSAMLGRSHPEFGMAMDVSQHFHTASSQLVTQSLTYNAEQLCWELRFIGDEDVLTFRNGQFFNDENQTSFARKSIPGFARAKARDAEGIATASCQ